MKKQVETVADLAGLKTWDPIWCQMDNRRVRFVRVVDETAVEVADNDGKILPDYRHPALLIRY